MHKIVAIVHGAIPDDAPQDEQDTLIQMEAIAHALNVLGYESMSVPISLNLEDAAATLLRMQPEFAVNLVESVNGQGRLIHLGPALLDALRIPYTGAGTEAMFLTSNKILAKQVLRSAGIPTPNWWTARELVNLAVVSEGRSIIKSVWEHASIGLSEASIMTTSSTAILLAALERHAPHLGGEAFAETYIDGREFNLAVLASVDGPQVLPPAEISFDDFPDDKLKIVDYRAKWEEESFEYHHTPRRYDFADSDAALLTQLQSIALQCWQVFNLRGYARIDFRVDAHSRPFVLEINANPCLSPDAGFMAAAERAGLSMTDVVHRIIQEIV